MNISILFTILSLLQYSCTKNEEGKLEYTAANEILVESMVTENEYGDVTYLQGFQGIEDTDEAPEDLDEALFTYTAPDNMDADFSMPVMTTSSFLTAQDSCKNIGYQEEIPLVREVLEDFESNDQCGLQTFNICIRLKYKSDLAGDNYFYLETPKMNLMSTCANTTALSEGFGVKVAVKGLVGKVSLTLNSESELNISSNGVYEFSLGLKSKDSYEVAVSEHPKNQFCSVSKGSGVIERESISNIILSCANVYYSLGGTISGNTGNVVLRLGKSTQKLTLDNSARSFEFGKVLAEGATFVLEVESTPEGQRCTVVQDNKIVESDVMDMSVICSDIEYLLSGNVTGLDGTLELTLNESASLSLDSSGSFSFSEALFALAEAYTVSVSSAPARQVCSLTGATGTISGDVSNVSITCTTPEWSLGGSISGLDASGLELSNNSGAALSISSGSSSFTFPDIAYNADSYSVVISSQPTGLICNINEASGTVSGASISNIAVTCSPDSYSVSGSISGLVSGRSLTIQLNGANDLTLSADGSFSFPDNLANESAYTVSVSSNPDLQNCSVSSGSGIISSANIVDVSVTCVREVVMYSTSNRKGWQIKWANKGGGRENADYICSASGNKPSSCPAGVHAFINTPTSSILDMPTDYSVPTDASFQSSGGDVVADDWADLTDGTLDQSIKDVGIVDYYNRWWSGVDIDSSGNWIVGDNGFTCGDWDTVGESGKIGYSYLTDARWVDATSNCGEVNSVIVCLCY